MELTKVLLQNYLPYAKGTIVDRAIPDIDGFKPSQRKILVTMWNMGLLTRDKTKSTNIVGTTMRLHPHGDQTIYDTLVHMSTGYGGLNVPYVESKGNFGKVYSRDMAYAASRYTEAKLAPICAEIFDGIDEEAVEFQPNFDGTMQEPVLLPVKFPTILTNPSSGIAVGFGSSIPSFGLKNVCNSVIGILEGRITGPETLVKVLGIPQFTVGGCIHTTEAEIAKLAATGRGTLTMTGTTTNYSDSIVITEIPYRSTAEDIVAAIQERAKSGELKEVAEVSDEIDINGFKLVVQLKRGANVAAVLKKLYMYTKLRNQISFYIRVIIDNVCHDTINIYELLLEWIKFRRKCVHNIYSCRLRKALEKEHILSTWDKIRYDVKEAALIIVNSNDDNDTKVKLIKRFGLDEVQANYIMDMKVRELNAASVRKYLKKLEETRENIKNYQEVVSSDAAKDRVIIADQKRIIEKYGTTNKTTLGAPIVEDTKEEEVFVDDSPVTVALTKRGYVKRLTTMNLIASWEPEGDDEVVKKIPTHNNEHILIFTYDGTVYKVPVSDIDASRGKVKDTLASMVGIDQKQIMLVDTSGDYSKFFHVVFPNGRGYRVPYSRAMGKRSKYRSLFEPCEPGQAWYTYSTKFFIITRRRKASYCDLTYLGLSNNRAAFKGARIGSGDSIFALWGEESVPDMSKINLDKYRKEYTVLIGPDELWEGAQKQYFKSKGLDENGNPIEEDKPIKAEESNT